MSYQQDSSGEFDEASEFDLVDSADEDTEEDPEGYSGGGEPRVPEESDAADAVEQTREVPGDEDDERHSQ